MSAASLDVTETLMMLISDIVSAQVVINHVSVEELPHLIANVFGELSGLGRPAPAEKI